MRIAVLGPLMLDGNSAGLGPRDRVVLSALSVRVGEPISTDSLAEAIWADAPPESAVKVVQGCIVRLRKLLGPDTIKTTSQGYVLTLSADTVDKSVFEWKLSRGRELLTLDEPERAGYIVGEALDLWRGTPLSELDGWAPGAVERHRLEELRRDAEELSIDAALRAGRCREVLGKAQAMVADAPLRERRWALLALAQYQSGQQAQSLRTLGQVKAMLATELGLDSGPDLVALEQAILRQDPSLVAESVLTTSSDVCPYQGLVAYDVADADGYFGRVAEIEDCLARLRLHGIVVVVGPSGSGKSSLVRAGVAAALQRDGHRVTVVTPGVHPLDALSALPVSSRHSVLVLDQFEEALTLCDDLEERAAFFRRVVEESDRRTLVIAVRADRLGDLTSDAGLASLIERSLHLLGPMGSESLHEAIEAPARQAGLLLEPGLVDLLVREVEGEPGALPLLSHALRETWVNREGRTLTVEGYRATGGIRGAVARTAEEMFGKVPADQHRSLRDLLLRLVAPSADSDPSRSKTPRRLVSSDREHEELISLLVDARLVTSDDGVLELAHEALVREWPRLRGWLDEDKEGQRILRHLANTADAWDSMGRPDSELYRGIRLAQASDWLTRRAQPDLTTVEREFLDASKDLVDADLRAAQRQAIVERRARRRTLRLTAGLGVVLVLALIAAGLAIGYQRDAGDRAQEADANRLSALSRSVEPLNLSLLLAVAANDVAETPATEDALLQGLVEHRRAMRIIPIGGHPDGAAVGADGEWLYVSLVDRVVAWRIGSTEPVVQVADWWEPLQISASPTSDIVAMQGHDENDDPIIAAFTSAGDEVLQLDRFDIGADFLNGTGFSSDGSLLYVLGQRERAQGGSQQIVFAINLATGKKVREIEGFATRPDRWPGGAMADDGSALAGWDSGDPSKAVLVDLGSGKSTRLDVERRPVEINGYIPFATGAAQLWDDGEITLFDTSGRSVQQIGVHAEPVRDIEISDDGTWAATVDDAGAVYMWDIGPRGRWTLRESLPGHSGAVRAVQSTPDGSTLMTASDDGNVIAWDTTEGGGFGSALTGLGDRWMSNRPVTVEKGKLVVAPVRPPPAVVDGFPDASMVSASFVDPSTGEEIDRVPVGRTDINTMFGSSVSLSPDRSLVAVTSTLATTVLDVATREVVSKIVLPTPKTWTVDWPIPSEYVWCSEWTADGSRLLIGAEGGDSANDGAIVVADPHTGEVLDRVELDYAPQVMRRSPDGSTIAVARALQTSAEAQTASVDLLSAETLERTGSLEESDAGFAFDLAYSPDGDKLAIGGLQGALAVFDSRTGELLRSPVRLHDQFIQQVEWLPGGTTVVTTSPDGKAALYDTERGVVRTSGLPGSDSEALGYTYALSVTDEEVTVVTGAEPGRRYPMDSARWREYACTVAGGNLSRDQWESYLPGRPYERLCGL